MALPAPVLAQIKPHLSAVQKRLLEQALAQPVVLARDAKPPTAAEQRRLLREREHFRRVRRVEDHYAAQLRKVARHVGDFIRAFPIGDPEILPELERMLRQYSEILAPWARATAARMIAEVSRRDASAWFKSSREIGLHLREEIDQTPIGDEVRRILADQVELITSLPIEASRRVQSFTQQYVAGGRRFADLVSLVRDSGSVTASRATLIARTETAKAASAIVQARAKYIGADSYVWRTARDADVRRMHRRLENTVHRWDDPPVAEDGGQRHHPGEFPNCRCWAEPILPAVIR